MPRITEIPALGLIGSAHVCKMLGISPPTLIKIRNLGLFPAPEPFTTSKYPFWKRKVILDYIKKMKKK